MIATYYNVSDHILSFGEICLIVLEILHVP